MEELKNQDTIMKLWNSLEIVKLAIAVLTPIIIAFIAFRFNKILKRVEKQQWTNQKIIEKRIEIFDLIVPKLNDLFCYFCYIGNWKEISPLEIIEIKRKLDKEINIYSPLFSEGLAQKYNDLIEFCFETFTSWGEDAKIKSLYENRKLYGKRWEDNWKNYFNKMDVKDVTLIKEKYYDLMNFLKNDLDIYQSGIISKSNIPNINFR
jgi:hypothetical protein